ncbi:adenosylcobinamide-GDP ribazoletransferase [Escherichia coli]|nr:adenosylcobinamide-GDP ribazoletransferase [Escherichia coli]
MGRGVFLFGSGRGDCVACAGFFFLVVTMVAIFILGQLLKRTLGGQTGDTLGAAIELGELVFLLALL